MTTIVTVKATLPYALRNPDCTPTPPAELMRMAAKAIEELERQNHELGEALSASRKQAIDDGRKLYELEQGKP